MKLIRSILLSTFLLAATFGLQAQQNYGIAYQAVARDAGGDALENATLDVRFTLLDAASSAVWTETHSAILTDEFGLINLTIGSVAGAGDLAAIDWSSGGYSFQVEVNSGGGFASFGMMAVTAVPVALFAANAPEGTADSLAVVLAQEIADRASGDAGLATDLSNLAGLIATNTGAIATNETGIGTNAGAISTNAGDISTNAGDISTNAGGISTNAGAISTNAGGISTNAGDITTNAGDISTNTGAISTNASGISTNAGAISTNAGDIGTNAGDIAVNAAATSANATDIGTNASDISTNAGDITTNGTAIAANATDIGNNASNIDQLQTDLASEASTRASEDATLLGLIQSNDGDILALNTSVTQLQSDLSDLSDLVEANDHFDFSAGVLTTEGDIDKLKVGTTVTMTASDAASVQLAVTGKILTTNLTVQNDLTVSDNITAGSASFTGNVLSTEAPIADDHLANKGYVDNVVDAEIAGYTQAIVDEAARAEAAEAALDARIDSLDGAHSSEIAQVQSNLDAEIGTTNGEVTSLQGQVDSNDGDITAIQGTLGTLTTDVADNAAATVSNFQAIAGVQSDVDANELASDAADGTLQTNIDDVQDDVDANELSSIAADGVLQTNIDNVQGDVDANETAANTAIAAVQSDVDANELASNAADGTLQGNIDAVQSNLDAEVIATNADVTNLQGQISSNDGEISTNAANISSNDIDISSNASATVSNFQAIQSNDTDITNLQLDIDQNETDSDAADVTLQTNINTVQGDVDQNEIDSDAADVTLQTNINTVQGDVDQNEIDSDAADVTLQTNINTVQGDVDQNETDSDAADSALQGELDASQAGAGLGTDGAYAANAGTTYLTGSTSLVDADEDLDAALKAAQDDVDANELASDNADGALQSELDASQTGAGLGTDGAYTANGSATYIGTSSSLVDADEDLDAALAAVQADVDANELASDNAEGALQSELDASQTGAGLGTDGAYTANGSATYIGTSSSLVDADEDLDAALAAVQADVDANELASDNAESALQSELDASQTGAGLGTDGAYTANGSSNFITTSTSLVDADEDLDQAIYDEQTSRETVDNVIFGQITALNTPISQNTVSAATNAANITTNSGDISTNAADIVTLQTDLGNEISATNSDVTSLQSQIDNLPTSPAEIASVVEDNDFFDELFSGVITAEGTVSMLLLPALNVSGATTLQDVDVNGTFEVNSIATSEIETTGDVIAGDDVIVGDRITVAGTSAFTGAATFASTVAVTGTVSGATPTADGHLTTKLYVDGADATIQSEVDASQTGAGLDADGGYTADATTNYLTAASSLKDADDKLDAQAKVNADAIAQEVTDRGTAVSGEATARANQDDAIEAGAGLNANGTYATPSGTNYLDATTTLSGADAALDSQVKTNADAISTNATSITANDFFDQTGVKLAVGAGKTWTELEAATGTFTSSASAGTLTLAAGSITDSNGAVDFGDDNLSTTGTLDAGATTLGSTLDVTGAGEFDSSLGVDGNLRVGSGGASTFQVNGTSGALSTSGDISTSGGVQASTAIVTGTALLQGTTTASTMSVSNFLTLNNEPLLDSHAATKLYVDTEIDSHTHDMPQAFSFASDVYEGMGADLSADGTLSVTITVTGANLAAGTFKLHLDGGEFEVTETVTSATEISFTLTRANVLTMTSRSDVVVPQLSIDGIATGLCVFVKL